MPEIRYTLLHEILPEHRRSIAVASSGDTSGAGWFEFTITERDLDGRCFKVSVFDESFAVFAAWPEFFAALGDRSNRDFGRIEDFVALLNELGAVDKTPKLPPRAPRRERLHYLITQKLLEARARGRKLSAREAADLALDAIGEKGDADD